MKINQYQYKLSLIIIELVVDNVCNSLYLQAEVCL